MLNPRKQNRGFVLVTVLWILALLTVVSLGFGRRAMIERRMAWYALDKAQAQQMARGAVERAIFELANQNSINQYLQQIGYTGLDQSWAKPVDLFQATDYFTLPDESSEGYTCTYRILDSERWFSINQAPEAVLREIDGLSTAAIRAIMHRRERQDSDDPDIRTHAYLTTEELFASGDIGFDDWFGDDRHVGLVDMLTVWGGGKVNLNTAPEAVLRNVPDLNRSVIQGIIDYRQGQDGILGTSDDQAFKTQYEVAEKLEISTDRLIEIWEYCTLNSSSYTIEATATARGGKVQAQCTATVAQGGSRYSIVHPGRGGLMDIKQWREDAYGA
jgi:hypothetical protein